MKKPLEITAAPQLDSPFRLPELMVPPQPLLSTAPKDPIYAQCPAWQHKAQRTFVFYSPIDMEFSLSEDGWLRTRSFTQEQFDKFVILQEGWRTGNHAVVQVATLMSWAFLTDQKDVWVHQYSDPSTSANNNFTCVEGWWNNSAWPRIVNPTFVFHDLTKPVTIKRGDPIFRVSFYPRDLNQKVNLTIGDLTEKIQEQMTLRANSAQWFRGKNFFRNVIFARQTPEEESKCPFSFLWKK